MTELINTEVEMKEPYGVVYKVINKINKKVYIGVSTKVESGVEKAFDTRYGGSILNTHNHYLVDDIHKYGIDSFEIIKAYDIAYNKEELDQKERDYIESHKSNYKEYGYNIQPGGTGEKNKPKKNNNINDEYIGVNLKFKKDNEQDMAIINYLMQQYGSIEEDDASKLNFAIKNTLYTLQRQGIRIAQLEVASYEVYKNSLNNNLLNDFALLKKENEELKRSNNVLRKWQNDVIEEVKVKMEMRNSKKKKLLDTIQSALDEYMTTGGNKWN